jgi:hypothetical protein
MKLKRLNVKLIHLPADIELTLFHIREALKARKLFNTLSEVGFDDSNFHSDFSDFVLGSVGFDDPPDDLYSWYSALIDKHSKKIDTGSEKCTRAAIKIYVELMIEKKRRLKELRVLAARSGFIKRSG